MKANGFAKPTVNRAARLLLTLAVLLGSAAARAATRTWDGSASALWSNPLNWVENAVPGDGDYLVFPSPASNRSCTNNLTGLDVLTIEITSTGYFLHGNAIGVIDSVRMDNTMLTIANMYMDITLESDAQFRMLGYNDRLFCHGDIDIGTYTLRAGNYGDVIFEGPISGSGSVVKFGSGDVYFEGSTANTYAGSTTVEDGTLVLDQASGDSIPHDLIIEDGATARQDSSFKIVGDVKIYGSGTYDMNGFSETIGDLILNDGANFDSGASTLTLSGNVAVDGGVSVINGRLSLLSGNHDFNILYNGLLIFPGAHCLLNADVNGAGSLIKKGPGDMRISGNNTYSGTTIVEGGDIMIESNTALGTSAAGTTVNAGSQIYMSAFYQASSVHISGETLSLGGDIRSYGPTNFWTGAITLTDDVEVHVSSGKSLEFSGAIGGTGGVTKKWAGTLIYSGSSVNSYTGDTTVEEGVLALDGINVVRDGILTIGDGAGAKESVVVRFLASSPIHSAADVVIKADGLLDFNDHTDDLGYVLFDRGQLSTGTGVYRMNDDLAAIESFNTNWTAMISGFVDLRTQQRTFDIDTGVFFDLSAPTEGSGGITKAGGGRLRLGWPNTYEGSTIVQEGYLQLWHDDSLGATNAGTVVESGASLHFGKSLIISNEVLELNGFGAPSYGALDSEYDAGWHGPVVLNTDSEIYVFSSRLEIDGPVSGSGDLVKVAIGTLALIGNDDNTYTGNTYVNSGTLVLDKSVYNATVPGNLYIGDGIGGADADVVRLLTTSQIPNNTRISIAGSGLFDMNNLTEYFGSLEGSGHVDMGSGNLGVGYDNGSTAFSGLIEGSGEFRKYGTGTFELSGNNTYSDITEIYAGILLVNGSQPGSDVIVNSPGTLGGIGTVGAIFSSGSVAPGASAGQLDSGSATLQSGSTFDVELDGYTPVDYDQLDVNGTTALGNANLAVSWGFVPAVGDKFTILDNDGADAVVGTFNGLAEGASLAAGNVTLKISYAGGTGNDVVLAATEVTELEPLAIISIDTASGDVEMAWVGGVPFYVVEKKTSLTNAIWQAVTIPTRDMVASLLADTTNGFYRVKGGN